MALIVVVLALALSARGIAAQAPAGAEGRQPSAAVCDSLLAASTADSTKVGVRLLLTIANGGPLPSPHPGLILQEIALHFRLPRPLRVPVFSPPPLTMQMLRVLPTTDGPLRHPTINGTYAFTVHKDASVTQARVLRPSLVPTLDSAVLSAIDSAGAERAFLRFGEDVPSDSADVRLRLTSGGESGGVELTLFASMFPRLPLADAVLLEPAPEPTYPEEERRLKLGGEALFQVVVDIDGLPHLATVELLRATTLGFAQAGLAVLPRMRWTPARVGACAVPQLVHVPFRFRSP